jgi:hypothetical protein
VEAHRAGEIEPPLRRPRQVEALALLERGRAAECAAMDLWPYQGVKAMCLRVAGREREASALVDSLRRAVTEPDEAGPGFADAVPAQELAIYYAWTADAALALRYLQMALERSPVGVDQRIVQSGIFDRVRAAPEFTRQLEALQDAAWPRVLEQRRRLDAAAGTTPF